MPWGQSQESPAGPFYTVLLCGNQYTALQLCSAYTFYQKGARVVQLCLVESDLTPAGEIFYLMAAGGGLSSFQAGAE